jgi:hypothetical protein
MFTRLDCESKLPDLQGQLRRAHDVTPGLMSKVIAGAGTRFTMPSCAGQGAKIDRLIASEVWTEAALALVELELPQWRLHRLVCEENTWVCWLSQQWAPRVWHSDCAETRRQSLPLAVLGALIEAQQCSEPLSMRAASSVLQCGAKSGLPVETMCCDNFP